MKTFTSDSENDLRITRRALIIKGVPVSLIGWDPATDLYTFNTVEA